MEEVKQAVKKISVKDNKGDVVGEISVEKANSIVADLLLSGVCFKNVDVLGVKITLKTLTKKARAELVKRVSDMEGSDATIQDTLVILNLSYSLVSMGDVTFNGVEEAISGVEALEEHVFERMYGEYLTLMYEVTAAVSDESAVKN